MNLKDDIRQYRFTQEELLEYLECEGHIEFPFTEKDLVDWLLYNGAISTDNYCTISINGKEFLVTEELAITLYTLLT